MNGRQWSLNNMKKFIFITAVIFLTLVSCVNITQEELATDPSVDLVTLNYSQINKSLFIAADIFDPQGYETIDSVVFHLYRRDSLKSADEELFLKGHLVDTGPPLDIIDHDGTFSYLLDSAALGDNEGYYRVSIQAFDEDGNSSDIAEEEELVAPNSPPELFLLDSPNTYEKGDTVIFRVRATDPQGADDISSVFYSVLQPNGTYKGVWEMVDNGLPFDLSLWTLNYFGDEIANDGIYTSTVIINKDNEQQGDFIFYFTAQDIHGAKSDTLEKTITIPGVHLLSPNWADTLNVSQTYSITWESAYVNKVTIQYTTNANSSSPQYQTIGTEFAAKGNYNWTVPHEISSNCRVKIFDSDKPSRYDISDNSFTIKP